MKDLTTTFKINSAFQLTGRQFYIIGDILSGTVKIGMIADLTEIGIEKSVVIETVEFALFREGEEVGEEVGLGFSGLTEAEKEVLKTKAPFATAIRIR